MEHILVPTDFSDCADHALDAAINIAKKFQAALHLYTCLNSLNDQEAVENSVSAFKEIQSRFKPGI